MIRNRKILFYTVMEEVGYHSHQNFVCFKIFEFEVKIICDTFFVSDGSYLKYWATKLDCPILSIDYSLAPEAPFPRALEEVFYAYCWALKNAELLGWTGENIVLVGDSAGGNLVTACTIKCIEMGIRKPKGLLTVYAVFMANYAAAPSRFLGMMDVILTYTTYTRLFPAYNGQNQKEIVIKNREIPKSTFDTNYPIPNHYLFSPHWTPDDVIKQFPPTVVLTTNLDPCLDEAVEFSKKLKKEKVNSKLELLEGLPHSFIQMAPVSRNCGVFNQESLKFINQILYLISVLWRV
jgi:hormone-sensitive lipase